MRKIFLIFAVSSSLSVLVRSNGIDKLVWEGMMETTTDHLSLQSQEINKIIISPTANEECFDELMTVWFIEFDLLQKKGHPFSKADQEASLSAVKSFRFCSGIAQN